MSEHIKALTEQKRIALARTIAETFDLFPNDVHPWQVYVTMHPRVSYKAFIWIALSRECIDHFKVNQ